MLGRTARYLIQLLEFELIKAAERGFYIISDYRNERTVQNGMHIKNKDKYGFIPTTSADNF